MLAILLDGEYCTRRLVMFHIYSRSGYLLVGSIIISGALVSLIQRIIQSKDKWYIRAMKRKAMTIELVKAQNVFEVSRIYIVTFWEECSILLLWFTYILYGALWGKL